MHECSSSWEITLLFSPVVCWTQAEFGLLLRTLQFMAFKDGKCLMFFAASFLLQILLGVLRVSSRSSSLQLQDRSSTLPCVISHKDGSPFADTALLGMSY